MKIVIDQQAIPDYRVPLFKKLIEIAHDKGYKVDIYHGDCYFAATVKSSKLIAKVANFRRRKQTFFLGRRVALNTFSYSHLSSDILVLELNPRILNTWFYLIIRRCLLKKTICWGHAWSRGGKSEDSKFRKALKHLASGLIVYTKTQQQELIQQDGLNVFSAPNALYLIEQMFVAKKTLNDFIYVGRLVKEKKVALAIESFILFLDKHKRDSKLHIIGTGPELENLKKLIPTKHETSIIFYGHNSDLKFLRKIYSLSIAAISPGYVGLSITQAFALGTPMIVAREEDHSPELEAFKNNVNGTFFDSDDSASLCEMFESYYLEREGWLLKKDTIIEHCKENYSIEQMASSFLYALENV